MGGEPAAREESGGLRGREALGMVTKEERANLCGDGIGKPFLHVGVVLAIEHAIHPLQIAKVGWRQLDPTEVAFFFTQWEREISIDSTSGCLLPCAVHNTGHARRTQQPHTFLRNHLF